MSTPERHVLVIANETVAGQGVIDAIRKRAEESGLRATVICPVNAPTEGYVVYQDTRRASAGRRLERTLELLRASGISATGFVVESDPVTAVKDALAQLDPRPTEIVVSTHPEARSGWLRRNVVDRIHSCAEGLPIEHVVADTATTDGETNVLVVANETVVGEPLLQRIRERAQRSPASFLIICPQSDVSQRNPAEAERRLRRTLLELRSEGIDAHGQVAHPDPYCATMHAVHDERIDEIIISTFPAARSGWLRRDLVGRIERETKLPVDHVVVEPETVGASA